MKKLFFAMIAAALFFSCEKSLTSDFNMQSKISSELTPQFYDQLEAMASGANGGAQVIRYESEWGFRFTDDETGVHAFINVTFEELCYGDRVRDIVDVQDVIINEKDGTPRIITLWKAKDVSVKVYERRYTSCDEYENAEPIFIGQGDYLWTDNNFGLVEEGDKNSVGFRLHGDGISINYKITFSGDLDKIKSRTKIMIK